MAPLGTGSVLLAPATCAVLRELGGALGDLRTALEAPLLRDEVALLRRLLYKNKNQHRTTLHYRRLAEAARRLCAVVPDDSGDDDRRQPTLQAPLREFADALTQGLPPPTSSGGGGGGGGGNSAALRGLGRSMPVPVRLPCRAEGRRLLSLLIESEEKAEQLAESLLRAYRMMRLLLSQTNFMPFCTTMLALTARLHTLLAELPPKRARCVECLAACESQLPEAERTDGAATASLPEDDDDDEEDDDDEDDEEDEETGSDGSARKAGGATGSSVAKQQRSDGKRSDDDGSSSSSSSDDGEGNDDDVSDDDDWGELLDSDDGAEAVPSQREPIAATARARAESATDTPEAEADAESDAASESESESEGGGGSDGVHVLASIPLAHGARLCISAGSVLDFGEGGSGWPRARTAVVNAANTGGLGGGGVDGAFVSRGGAALAADREALPLLPPTDGGGGSRWDRIRTGGAVATGPRPRGTGGYGTLFAKTVVHAVGPAYGYSPAEFAEGDALLRSAYTAAMECASGLRTRRQAEGTGAAAAATAAGGTEVSSSEAAAASAAQGTADSAGHVMEYVGFALLSAGIFRGTNQQHACNSTVRARARVSVLYFCSCLSVLTSACALLVLCLCFR
jgi:O-acetyl-ADP-ribose deacetylase (regulator of RNase III)